MKTIFVIDDEEGICKFIESIFSGNGYRVIKANSCDEALVLMNGVLPDLILMDIVMPEMSGIELCQKIKKKSSYENVPVIMMTGYDNEERKVDSYVSGANDYLVKPFNIGELVSKVRNELESLKVGVK